MKVLIIGGGGREHALAVAYAKSKRVKKVVMTPGNGLTDFDPSTPFDETQDKPLRASKIKNYPDVTMMDFDRIVAVCKKENIDLVDVAQDDVIAAGYVDRLEKLGIQAFGPSQKASQIEWDKQWAREFMVKYGLPIPKFESFNTEKDAIEYVEGLYADLAGQRNQDLRGRLVLFVKASGLALGKGVIKATNREEAIGAIKQMKHFGKAGETFLIEEGLVGEEFSLFALCDGKDYKVVSWAQDHKTAFDGDRGPNTGGIGSVTPAGVINTSIIRIIEVKILKPFIEGMQKEGRPYSGILYLGGMVRHSSGSAGSGQAGEVKIIEFNARWGDPEAEVILPGIKTDYLTIVDAVLQGKLSFRAKSRTLIHPKSDERDPSTRPSDLVGMTRVGMDKKVRISVAGCSRGYPGDYSKVKGKEIFGLTDVMRLPGISIFGGGIKREGKRFFVNGGRVFHLVAEGKDILEARKKAYDAMALINIDGDNLHYRKDIGWRDIQRLQEEHNN